MHFWSGRGSSEMKSNEISYLIGHAVCVSQCIAFIMVYRVYLGKNRWCRFPCLWSALLAVGMLVMSVVWNFGFFSAASVFSNMIYLFVTLIFFGGTAGQRCVASLINGIMCLLEENTVNYTASWLTGIPTHEVWKNPFCLVAMVVTNLVVGGLVSAALYRWRGRSAMEPMQRVAVSFFPCVAVALNIVLMLSREENTATLINLLLTLGLTVAVLVHVLIVGMLNDQVTKRQDSRFRAELERQRAEALLESYTAQRRLTHEFTNHINALADLLEQGDVKSAREYIASVSDRVMSGTTIMDTHNPLLDSILSRKYEEAGRQGVALYFDLCNLKQLPLGGTDLVIVFSNLLDNAIRGAAAADLPEIYLRIRKNREEYLVSVRNRVERDVEIPGGQLPLSTKKEPGHGMGLANVWDVLKKYGGEYTISCRGRWFRFTFSIPACSP